MLLTWDARPLMILGGAVSAVGYIGSVSSQSLFYLAVWFTISSKYTDQHCLAQWRVLYWRTEAMGAFFIMESQLIYTSKSKSSKRSLGLRPRCCKPPYYVCEENTRYGRPDIYIFLVLL